jgi:hypothetical protein
VEEVEEVEKWKSEFKVLGGKSKVQVADSGSHPYGFGWLYFLLNSFDLQLTFSLLPLFHFSTCER